MCIGWVQVSHVSRHRLTDREINYIKEQINNKSQVRKHSINSGHTPRNQQTLIY